MGVALAAAQHAPEQDRRLAGGRDDRLAVTATIAGSLIERVQRTGLQDRAPCDSSRASARASSRSIFALARVIPVSSGLTTTTRLTCGSRIRATSQQLPVTSNATRSDGSRLSASVPNPSGVLGTRPASEPSRPRRLRPRRSRGERPGRSLDQPTSPTPSFTSINVVDTQRENQRDNDTDRNGAQSSIQASRGGGRTKSTGSKPIAQTAYPSASSQEAPCPG